MSLPPFPLLPLPLYFLSCFSSLLFNPSPFLNFPYFFSYTSASSLLSLSYFSILPSFFSYSYLHRSPSPASAPSPRPGHRHTFTKSCRVITTEMARWHVSLPCLKLLHSSPFPHFCVTTSSPDPRSPCHSLPPSPAPIGSSRGRWGRRAHPFKLVVVCLWLAELMCSIVGWRVAAECGAFQRVAGIGTGCAVKWRLILRQGFGTRCRSLVRSGNDRCVCVGLLPCPGVRRELEAAVSVFGCAGPLVSDRLGLPLPDPIPSQGKAGPHTCHVPTPFRGDLCNTAYRHQATLPLGQPTINARLSLSNIWLHTGLRVRSQLAENNSGIHLPQQPLADFMTINPTLDTTTNHESFCSFSLLLLLLLPPVFSPTGLTCRSQLLILPLRTLSKLAWWISSLIPFLSLSISLTPSHIENKVSRLFPHGNHLSHTVHI
ncbi:hypothetical protein C7M84_008304 [Penaeus vannamei]|uniref:Uncharacterized protein n=1 Tax=Penaeus vannamei TaxID=6689 RepID=A0A423TA14_PENVA|nr:hypothetical protein C7M84_008304 [Penaeus vannamei]